MESPGVIIGFWICAAVTVAGSLMVLLARNLLHALVFLVLAFLGAFYLLATASAFAGNGAGVAEVYRTPDVQAALFFACFILTDPPTSPTRYRAQVICGVLVGITAFAVYESIGAVYYLLAGVLVGNVWEAWNRRRP